MATFTRVLLSGSTNGRPIAVTATSSPGTTIHTAVSGTSSIDEIILTASNIDSSDRTLTLEHGGTSTSDQLKVVVPANSIAEIPPLQLQNSLVLKAFADSANKINLAGKVNRIS